MRVLFPLFLTMIFAWTPLAYADPPHSSIRPMPREIEAWRNPHPPKIKVFYRSEIRPKPRVQVGYVTTLEPISVVTRSPVVTSYTLASTRPIYRSPRPLSRPEQLATSFTRKTYARTSDDKPAKPVRVASTQPTVVSSGASLCGDARIKGVVLGPIAGTLPGCGVENPVRVSSIDGVALSQHSIMDCTTAKALRGWVANSLKPVIHRRGGGVKSLSVPSHYSCRTRNSQPGAKISEHGKGRAIDISAINLRDGSKITVLDGWKNHKDKKILKRLHGAACGPFGTVLGPEANKFHLDHFHFDTARYRGGAYCE